MNCANCNREAEFYERKPGYGHSEAFYFVPDVGDVCRQCLKILTGQTMSGNVGQDLHVLQEKKGENQ
jgi:hypothetical protein